MIHYVDIDGGVWPVDIGTDSEDSSEWTYRYGTPERREQQRLSVASVLRAYSDLLDPNRPAHEAQQMLRRARQAAKSVG